MFLEIIVGGTYSLGAFGTYLRGWFIRQVALNRAKPDPTDAQIAVNEALREIRTKFVSLFKDERTRNNALKLFPTLANLPELDELHAPVDAPSQKRIILDALVFPITLPINGVSRAARNIVDSERKDMRGKKESYQLLAEHEDDPELRAAYLTCDDDKIVDAVMAKAKRDAEAEIVASRMDPKIDLSKPLMTVPDEPLQIEPVSPPLGDAEWWFRDKLNLDDKKLEEYRREYAHITRGNDLGPSGKPTPGHRTRASHDLGPL